MAKQPKRPAEPERKLTDPEFDDYDCSPEPKGEESAESKAYQESLFSSLKPQAGE